MAEWHRQRLPSPQEGCGKRQDSAIVNDLRYAVSCLQPANQEVPVFTSRKNLSGIVILALAASTLLAACGDGEEPRATPGPAQTPTVTTPEPTDAIPTLAPGTPLTLSISSISPNPAQVGDEVTITFETQPTAVIGLQITDAQGETVVQTQLTAGSDGTVTFEDALEGPTGTWSIEAAAGATVPDLLALQIAPTPGPHSAKATFEMQ
jgi:ABC-type glycerol-3-phosphate transport system substrate-binding protein